MHNDEVLSEVERGREGETKCVSSLREYELSQQTI